jgi:hypothetical protein
LDTLFENALNKIKTMNNYLKYSLIALPILVGGFLIYKKLNPKKKEGTTPPPPPQPTIPTTKPEVKNPIINVRNEFPLKKGSRGAKVKELQGYILKKDPKALPKFGADGDFGNETEGAMQKLFPKYTFLGKISVNNQAELDEIK